MEGRDQDLKVEAIRGGVRGLKIDDVAAATRGGLKMDGVASEAADDCDLKRKEAKRPADGEMFRLRKELKAAWDHWFLTCRKTRRVKREEAQAPGEATQEKAQQAPEAGKKRKKVVKFNVRKEYVEQNRACPFSIIPDFSAEQLARSTANWRQMYAAGKFLEAKNHEYWNALIAQQDEFGYAVDEKEVTDDEDEEEVVKKN